MGNEKLSAYSQRLMIDILMSQNKDVLKMIMVLYFIRKTALLYQSVQKYYAVKIFMITGNRV